MEKKFLPSTTVNCNNLGYFDIEKNDKKTQIQIYIFYNFFLKIGM